MPPPELGSSVGVVGPGPTTPVACASSSRAPAIAAPLQSLSRSRSSMASSTVSSCESERVNAGSTEIAYWRSSMATASSRSLVPRLFWSAVSSAQSTAFDGLSKVST